MANPERLNPNNENEDFNSFSSQPDETQPIGENQERLNPERVRRIGHTALERYNLLTPKLEEQQDAQRRTSEGLANLYYEMREGDSTRAERIAVLEREIESIGLEIDSLQQQLDLARAALDELEGRTPQSTESGQTNVDGGATTENAGETENSAEEDSGDGHYMYNIETTDGPIVIVDGQVSDGRSEEAKRRNPLPSDFAEQVQNGLLDNEEAAAAAVENVETTDEAGYTVHHNIDGTDTYTFSDGPTIIMPNVDDMANFTDGTARSGSGGNQSGEEWEQAVSPEEAAEVERQVAEEEAAGKMKKNSGRFKKWAVGLGLSAALLGGILSGPIGQAIQSNNSNDLPQNTPIEQVAEAEPATPGGNYEDMNAVFDYDSAYSMPGLYTSVNKPNAAAFACGAEVDAICEGDDIRAIEYVMQVPETMANYVGHMPDQLRHPDDVGIDSQVQLAERYDSLSNEELDAVYQHYCDVFENYDVTVTRGTISGPCDNAYEYVVDQNGSLSRGNVELGRSTTNEDATPVITYTIRDKDGTVICELVVKDTCRQAVDKKGTNDKSYEGMQERNPDEEQHYDSGNETQGNETQGNETQGNETQGNETQGNETQGNETQGTESQGVESQGTESQGTESQGVESQGTESQGVESQGTESQGIEDQPSVGIEDQPSVGIEDQPSLGTETQGAESQGIEDQPSVGVEDQPSLGNENQENIQPKDPENHSRIDQNILDDNGDYNGSETVTTSPTPSEEMDAQEPTQQPTGDVFEGTEPDIQQSETSQEAESVQPTNPENDYTPDRGGAHDNEYAPNQDNTQAQEEADSEEIPIPDMPSTPEGAQDTLGDLGIS